MTSNGSPIFRDRQITRSRPVIASAFALRSRATVLHDLGAGRGVAAGSVCVPISAVTACGGSPGCQVRAGSVWRRTATAGRSWHPLNLLLVAAYFIGMSTNTFLVIVASIILVLLGSLLVQKYEACSELGGKACPVIRYGVSMDPNQQTRTPPSGWLPSSR